MLLFIRFWVFVPVLRAVETSEVVNVARGQPCEVSILSVHTSCDTLTDGNISKTLPEAKVVDDRGNVSNGDSNAVSGLLYRIQLRTPTFVLQIVVWFVPSAHGIDADLQSLEIHWEGKNPKDQQSGAVSSAPAYIQLIPEKNIVRLAVRFHAEAETVVVGFTRPQRESCPQLTEVAVMAKAADEDATNEVATPLEELPRALFHIPRSQEKENFVKAEVAASSPERDDTLKGSSPEPPKRTSMSRSKDSTSHQTSDGSRLVKVKVSWVPGRSAEFAKQRLANPDGVHLSSSSDLNEEEHETSVLHALPAKPALPAVPRIADLPTPSDLPDVASPASSTHTVITDQASEIPLSAKAAAAAPSLKGAAQEPTQDGAWTAVKLQHRDSEPTASTRRDSALANGGARVYRPMAAVLEQARNAAESVIKVGKATTEVSSQVLTLPGPESAAPQHYKASKFLARHEDSAFPGATEVPHIVSFGIIGFAMIFAVMVVPSVRLCTAKEEPSDYDNAATATRPTLETTQSSSSTGSASPRSEPCAEPSESEPEKEPLNSSCSPELGDAHPLQKEPLHLPGLPLVPAVAAEVPHKPKPEAARSVVLLFASPLVYRHPSQGPTPLPQLQFGREWQALTRACRTESGSPVPAVVPFLATSEALQGAVAGTLSFKAEVLHLSMHSKDNCLVLDNGSCTAHFLECRALRGLLECTGSDPPRLVFLGACNSRQIGFEFLRAGVPHVICTTREVGDNAASIFARAFYRHLFRANSVMSAFRAARGALGASPDIAPAEANSYLLLPEDEEHGTVLFPEPPRKVNPSQNKPDSDEETGASGSSDGKEGDAGSSSGSEEEGPLLMQKPRAEIMKLVPQIRRSPSRLSPEQREQLAFEQQLQALAAPPEDFIGRTLDVWAVLQHLSRRRVTIVCGDSDTCHGIGKTAILEAVARAMLLQSQIRCVRADLRSLTDTRIAQSPAAWASRVSQALKQQGITSGNRKTPRANRPPRCRGPSNTCLFGGSPGAIPEVLELIEVLQSVGDGVDRLVLLLDESDHLIQQRHFQEALTILLQGCGKLHVILTTQQSMVGDLGRFKVVHHPLSPLEPKAAARLFLQRCRRPLRWNEISTSPGAHGGNVIMTKENESEVLVAVARHSAVASLAGNPKLIVEQGSHVGPSLRTLNDLVPEMVMPDLPPDPKISESKKEDHIT